MLTKGSRCACLFLFCIFVCFIRPAIFSHLGVEYDYVALVYHRAVTKIYASIPALKRRHKIGHLIVILGIKITHSLSQISLLCYTVYPFNVKVRARLLYFCYYFVAKGVKIPVSAKIKGTAAKLHGIQYLFGGRRAQTVRNLNFTVSEKRTNFIFSHNKNKVSPLAR